MRQRLLVTLYAALVLAGCSTKSPSPIHTVTPPYTTATLAQGANFLTPSTMVASKSHIWSEIKLPAGCRFSSISPNLEWVIYTCGSVLWLAKAKDPSDATLVQTDSVIATSWAPDGARFAVGTTLLDQGNYTTSLWVVKRGTLERTLLHQGNFNSDKQLWSPSGKWVLVTGGGGKSSEAILIRTDGTGQQGTISPIRLMEWWHAASWSPDGTQLVYASEKRYPDATEVQVLDVDKGTITLFYTQLGASTLVPAWSPDGKAIAIIVQSYPGELLVLESYTRRILTRLVLPPEWNPGYDLFWSPSGDRIAFSFYTPRRQIGIVSLPGGKFSEPAIEKSVTVLGWTQDGKSLLTLERDRIESKDVLYKEILRTIPVQQ